MGQIYGVNPVVEALRAMPQSVEVVYLAPEKGGTGRLSEVVELCKKNGVPVENVGRQKLAAMSHNGVHQGVAARVKAPDYADFDDLLADAVAAKSKGLILVLDGIEDPHNLGALCRSASALGAQGVVIGKDRAAGITPAAIKSSAGALPLFKVARVTNVTRALEAMKEAGFWSVAADMSGDRPPEGVDMTSPIALVIGSEGKGIRRGVLEACDFRVCIPMVGPISSLNASVAGSILLAEVARQRRGQGK